MTTPATTGTAPTTSVAPTTSSTTPAPAPSKGHPRTYDIPFLDDDGGNFAFWKFRVRMVLELRELWGLVDGTVAKPAATAAAADIADWASKDRETRAQITLTLKDEPLNSVLFATTAKECL